MITLEKIVQQIQKEASHQTVQHKAAVLIPIVTIDNQLQLLFQVRSQKLKWQPGDICFPGGHVELTDPTLEFTAQRETFEELGIPINEITIVGQLPKFMATLGMVIYPFVGQIQSLDKLKLNSDEVEKIFTVPIEWFLQNNPLQATMQVAHKPANNFPFDLLPNRSRDWLKRSEHQIYFYHYSDYVIWGLTAQIVKSFIETIRS